MLLRKYIIRAKLYTDFLHLIHSLNATAICIVVTMSTLASPYSNVTESIVTNVCIKPLRQNLENCDGMGEHISKTKIFYSKEKLSKYLTCSFLELDRNCSSYVFTFNICSSCC